MRSPRRRGIALLAVVTLLGATGCATAPGGPVIVLQAVTPDAADEPAALQLDEFAREVDRISGGAISIEPVYLAAGRDTPRYDQVTAELVSSGDAELGWIPARTWDTEGVSSLRALNTPFLITDERHFQRTLSDTAVREGLLSGLPAAGVVGIDLVPEGMRHPFAWGTPLLGPEDYAGEVIRSPESATVWATLDALGASAVQEAPNSEKHRGMESSFDSTLAPFVTANVTFFPKANVVVAGTGVRERLTDAQWDVLARAAAATREWAFDTRPSELEAALGYCQRGGTLAAATAEQLAALEDATEPVVEELREDPVTRELITRIAALAPAGPAPELLRECPGVSTGSEIDSGEHLNGTYRTVVTEEALRASGVTGDSFIQEVVGEWTIAIDFPEWHVHQESDYFLAQPDFSGTLTFSDDTVRFQWTGVAEDWSSARVQVEDDGSLVFSDHRDGSTDPRWIISDRLLFDRWERVSDAVEPPSG